MPTENMNAFAEARQKRKDAEKMRRQWRQYYAESTLGTNLKSDAGAEGPWQIMPITKKDYLTRGKGKDGDVYDYDYAKQIRDFALDTVSRDLGSYWRDDSPENINLMKRYAGYNMGGRGLKNALKKAEAAGIDVYGSDAWLDYVPTETRNYVNWIVNGQDIAGTALTLDNYRNAWGKYRNDPFVEDIELPNEYMDDLLQRIVAANVYATSHIAPGREFNGIRSIQDIINYVRQKHNPQPQRPATFLDILSRVSAASGNTFDTGGPKKSWLTSMKEGIEEAGQNGHKTPAERWQEKLRSMTSEEYASLQANAENLIARQQALDRTREALQEGFNIVGSMMPQTSLAVAPLAATEAANKGDIVGAAEYFTMPLMGGTLSRFINKKAPSSTYTHTREMSLAEEVGKKVPEYVRHKPVIKVSNLSPKEEIATLIDRSYSGVDAPLETEILDMFGEPVKLTEEQAAAMRSSRFKKAYPNGVDIWHRGISAHMRDALNEDWRKVESGYGALFGSNYDLAKMYTPYGYTSSRNTPDMLTLMTPKGKMLDVGDMRGRGWSQLIMPDKIKEYERLTKKLWRNESEARIKHFLAVKDDLLGLYIPEFNQKFNSTDQIAAFLGNKSYPTNIDGVLLRNLNDGRIGNEVIWGYKRGIAPKALHPEQSYMFDLSDGTFLGNGGKIHIKPENRGKVRVQQKGQKPLLATAELPPVIVTPDQDYTIFLNSLPDNQKFTPESEYSTRRYWELNGKPKDFEAAKKLGMYTFDNSDNSWHANTIAWGKDGIGYFMKPRHHDTLKYELDWYNNGLITEEGGNQRQMNKDERADWEEFRRLYDLDTSGDFFKYIPKYASGGSIHIKPENRGKFTALKKRTGKSASWFKAHGTPAQRKMATFALNARKWRHSEGGLLDRIGAAYGNDYTKIREMLQRIRASR